MVGHYPHSVTRCDTVSSSYTSHARRPTPCAEDRRPYHPPYHRFILSSLHIPSPPASSLIESPYPPVPSTSSPGLVLNLCVPTHEMKLSFLLLLVLGVVLVTFLSSPVSAQTLEFNDFTAEFTADVPVAGLNAEVEPVVYYTDLSNSFQFGVSLLPGTGSNSFTITTPSAITVLPLNDPSTCSSTLLGVSLSSSVSYCNYTASWSQLFGGVMVVTMNSMDTDSLPRVLALSTYFILDMVAPSVSSSPAPSTSGASYPTGSLCLITYSTPGNVDYPWSVATQLTVSYNPTPVTGAGGASAVQLLSGSGTRTFTNRFGASSSKAVTLGAVGSNDNLLYLNSVLPMDTAGVVLSFSSAVQLPGSGPMQLVSQVLVANVSGAVMEMGSSRVATSSQAFRSNIPGFRNVSIGAGDLNALSPNYNACQAPITFTNGLRPPVQPSSSNGALLIYFSYYISDGQTYSVQTNLTITTSSQFANTQDQLGNPYQTITSVTGTRMYTHLPDGFTLLSTITGLDTSSAAAATASQRFYPYSLLSASPGVYTSNNVPFFDAAGVSVTLSPAIPPLGMSTHAPTLYSSTLIQVLSPLTSNGMLVDGVFQSPPLTTLQRQVYAPQLS